MKPQLTYGTEPGSDSEGAPASWPAGQPTTTPNRQNTPTGKDERVSGRRLGAETSLGEQQ
ncbi:hypothetical protein GCM10023346_25170 [Arthrobacter gyeryongensis]|uniref:Uncharacterized protein n=1 Tax=Arthrobacter gyeryongensis TaxID=1650592 RepID=A0ABP9SGI8_9MICC